MAIGVSSNNFQVAPKQFRYAADPQKPIGLNNGSVQQSPNLSQFQGGVNSPEPETGYNGYSLDTSAADTARTNIAAGETPSSSQSGSSLSNAAIGALGSGVSSYLGEQEANRSAGVNADYNQGMENYESIKPYWFNPDTDITPTFDEYMKDLPSLEETLNKSAHWGKKYQTSNGTLDWGTFADPGGGTLNLGLQATGMKKDKAGYISGGAWEGSTKGFTNSGWVGAIVGGITGAIKAWGNYDSAEKQDKQARSAARREYELRLKEYLAKKEKIRMARDATRSAEMAALAKERSIGAKQKKENTKTSRKNSAINRYNAIISSIQASSESTQQNQAIRQARWKV